MTPETNRPPAWLPRAVFVVAGVVVAVLGLLWVVGRLRNLLVQIFVALFIWIALEPAAQFLVKRGWKRSRATPVVFFGSLLLALGFLGAIVPVFVDQAVELTDNMPRYIDNVDSWLQTQDIIDIKGINSELASQFTNAGDLISAYGGRVFGGVMSVGNTIFGTLFQVVVIGLFAYSMVSEGPKLRRTVLSMLPPARQREVVRIWEIAIEKTGGYIYSRVVLAAASAVYTTVVLMLLGTPHPVALGMWVGVLSQFVPVIGTYIAAILPVIVALFADPISAVWVLVALVAYQQLENFFIAPRVSARTMAIHPAVSIGAVIAGANLLGAVGAVLALPVAATIQAAISTVLQRHDIVDDAELTPPPDDPEGTG